MASKFHAISLSVLAILVVGCGGDGLDAQARSASTLAGSGASGRSDGAGPAATFNNPVNVVRDSAGNLWVADFDNDLIRKVDPTGIVTTVVNSPTFQRPFGMAWVGTRLFVQTDANDSGARDATTGTIWEINTTTGVPTVIARNLGRPRGLAGLPDGRIVMSDIARHTIRILDPSNGSVQLLAGSDGTSGMVNANGAAARFSRPYGVCVLGSGSILVADQDNNRIRRVAMNGDVDTFAGSGEVGFLDGETTTSRFNGPQSVRVDGEGRVFVGDNRNFRFRMIADGQVSTVAGNGSQAFADGDRLMASFFGMEGFDISSDGTKLFVADGTGGEDGLPYNRVRVVGLGD